MNSTQTNQDPDRLWLRLKREDVDRLPDKAGRYNLRQWFRDNAGKLRTFNDFPAEFIRQRMVASIRPGSTVCIVTPQLNFVRGVVRIVTKTHAVFDISGSRHGQPGIADEVNIIWCSSFQF